MFTYVVMHFLNALVHERCTVFVYFGQRAYVWTVQLHPKSLTAGTWEYNLGKGRSSSQPSFSGSMFIFGGVMNTIWRFGWSIAVNILDCFVFWFQLWFKFAWLFSSGLKKLRCVLTCRLTPFLGNQNTSAKRNRHFNRKSHSFRWTVGNKNQWCLEDHPIIPVSKWLGSPPFWSHKKAFWRGKTVLMGLGKLWL